MKPVTAIKTGFAKSFQLKGRASRAEFWWFTAFAMVVAGLATLGDMALFPVGLGHQPGVPDHIVAPLVKTPLSWLALILVGPASLAVAARRLHDSSLSALLVGATVLSLIAYAGVYRWVFQPTALPGPDAFASVQDITTGIEETSDRLSAATPTLRALALGSTALQLLLLILCLRPSTPGPNRFGAVPAGGQA